MNEETLKTTSMDGGEYKNLPFEKLLQIAPEVPSQLLAEMGQEELTDDQWSAIIQVKFEALIKSYTSSNHRNRIEIIEKAFHFASKAHKGVKRKSGEPYITHPLEVAYIASKEIGLGSTSICSALLHDVVEDTHYTLDDIETLFNEKVRIIVDGLTKIPKEEATEFDSKQLSNYRKLFYTMVEDIRVLIIKIADRLHNMRTLGSMDERQQIKISGETISIYAPLAECIGLNRIKNELQNLALRYEHAEDYQLIEDQLKQTAEWRDSLFEEFTGPIRRALDATGIKYRIESRIKTIYSIWKKMQDQHVSFDGIYDVLAVRIIYTPRSEHVFDNNAMQPLEEHAVQEMTAKFKEQEQHDCFVIYNQLGKLYSHHDGRFRDWVTSPKSNGYQALHTTLMSKRGKWVEVQIRSERMHDIAENGPAAHWRYKGVGMGEDEADLAQRLESVKVLLENPSTKSMELLGQIHANFTSPTITVYTKKGATWAFPQGSTVLDFAYRVHTDIGDHTIGALINGRPVSRFNKLSDGDQVEVISTGEMCVKKEWLEHVKTSRAIKHIKQVLKRDRPIRISEGRLQVENFIAESGWKDGIDEAISRLCVARHLQTDEDLFLGVGTKDIKLTEEDVARLKKRAEPWYKSFMRKGTAAPVSVQTTKLEGGVESCILENPLPKGYTMTKDDLMKMHYILPEYIGKQYSICSHCNPVPGDDVVGFYDQNNALTVHQRQCSIAKRLKSTYGDRIVMVDWPSQPDVYFEACLYVAGVDLAGVVSEVTHVISKECGLNMSELTFKGGEDTFEGRIKILVSCASDIKIVEEKLKSSMQFITKVVRIKRFDDLI